MTVLDVHAQRVENETMRLQGAGLDVRGQVVDVTNHKALDAALDEAARVYGRLDVVFANAGIEFGSWIYRGLAGSGETAGSRWGF